MSQREATEKEKRIINRLALENYRRQFGLIAGLRSGGKPQEEFRFPYPDSEIANEEETSGIIPRKSDHDLLIEKLGGRCQVCGSTQDLEKHHIIPLEKGGPDVPQNLIVLCRECHVKTF